MPRFPRILLIANVALLVGGFTKVASADLVRRCGPVTAEQAVLDRDLECDDTGLVLQNPRTVLHLNGHTIRARRRCADDVPGSGILLEDTAEGAQVLGPGLITGFHTGMTIRGAARVQVRDVRVAASCARGIVASASDRTTIRDVLVHRTAGGPGLLLDATTAAQVEGAQLFRNDAPDHGGVVELREAVGTRFVGNRIVANRGPGLRLHVGARDNLIERNVILDHRPSDIVDEGAENTFALNVFTRGDGVAAPERWPLIGTSAPALPAVAGCGTMTDLIAANGSGTVTCPQDAGGSLRNSVVAYRLRIGTHPYARGCGPAVLTPPSSTSGGAVTCTNPNAVFPVTLEVTCCLH